MSVEELAAKAIELPVFASVGAILARDFSDSTTDVLCDRWTPGKLRHVIAALDGAPVALTTDAASGHTLLGVGLVSCTDDRLTVEIRYGAGPGETQRTRYFIPDLGGTIIPLAGPGWGREKWLALEAYRREVSAAVAVAVAKHGGREGRSWGRWQGKCARTGVSVRYTPTTENPAFSDRWGTPWSGLVHDGQTFPH